MAEKRFSFTTGVQDSNPQQYWKAYQQIVRKQYPGVESMTGAQFWGTNELGVVGLHDEILYHTGLLGSAVKLGRDLRTMPPMAHYETVDQVIADYEIIGIGYEWFQQELTDMVNQDIVLSKVGDLPILLADAEEDEHFAPYNNGETRTGGWTGSPLFVDGTTDFLQIIGRKGENMGSNIIPHVGAPSYALLELVNQYGQNFPNEEGRISPLRVERVMASHQNKRMLDTLYSSPGNVEQAAATVPNPLYMEAPEVIATHRLANPNDMMFFFEGWEEDMKERSKFRGEPMTEEVGHLTEKKTVQIVRSRFAYYWFFNRRVVLVKGVS